MEERVRTSHFLIKCVLHCVFLLSGATTIIVGQLLPYMSSRFELNDLEAAYFPPAQFIGSVLGTILTYWFGRSQKYVHATSLGCLLMAAGLALMNSENLYLCLFGFWLNGVGVGLTLPSINMLILELNPTRPAAALSVLNFFWGIGAILCKPFVDTLSVGNSISNPTLLLAMPLTIAAGVTFFYKGEVEKADLCSSEEAPARIPIWTTPLAWILALFNFIHVGFESGVYGWLTTYSERIDHPASIQVFSPTFAFFTFLFAGRIVAPLYLRFLDDNQAILTGLTVIFGGIVVLLAAHSAFALTIGATLSGLGTSAIFPTTLARFGRIFGEQAARRAMPLFISGTAGSIAVTWLIGFLSSRFGDLRSGMYVLIVCVVVLLVIQTALMWKLAGSRLRTPT